jgi:hypothetical protein
MISGSKIRSCNDEIKLRQVGIIVLAMKCEPHTAQSVESFAHSPMASVTCFPIT